MNHVLIDAFWFAVGLVAGAALRSIWPTEKGVGVARGGPGTPAMGRFRRIIKIVVDRICFRG
jgi:hypothetical protein